QRVELKAIGGRLHVHPIAALDESLDASARLPGRTRQAAREEHVVLRLELLQPRGKRLKLLLDVAEVHFLTGGLRPAGPPNAVARGGPVPRSGGRAERAPRPHARTPTHPHTRAVIT